MAFSYNTQTKLCLDEFANFFQINPLAFNGIDISSCVEWQNPCQFWHQFPYQSGFNLENLASYIFQAEQTIENYLNLRVSPSYECAETLEIPYYFRREEGKLDTPFIKFQTKWKNILEFGQFEKRLLGTATIAYSDVDNDGFFELATLTLTGLTEPTINECDLELCIDCDNICSRICPFKMISYNSITGTLILETNTWLLRRLNTINTGFGQTRAINGCDLNNFLSSIDIYIWERNLCLPQAEIVWNRSKNCEPNCEEFIVPACVTILDKCRGIFQLDYQRFNTITGCVENATNCDLPCEPPDFIRVWYKSGCTQHCKNCNHCGVCDNLKRAIAILAATLLPQQLCNCSCFENQIKYYQTDATLKANGLASLNLPFSILNNPFGTKLGAIEVYQLTEIIKENLCQ